MAANPKNIRTEECSSVNRSSYSASLTSSVLEYRHENGRRYHKFRNGSYLLSNDETENDRLDMFHEMCLQLLHRKLYLAPIEKPQRVIDLGTGTGIWAVDFADQHPEAEVIGCDLSPIQPTLVPPNVKFLVDDIESVKPGGWVEFQDWDGYPHSEDGSLDDTAILRCYHELYSAFDQAGYETRPGIKLEQWFKEAGFVNIRVEKFVIPYGVWPKDRHLKKVGAWNQAVAEANGFEGSALAVRTRYKNWTKEEVTVLASQARADGRKHNIHMLFNFYVVYGQRPEN
ncbi:hypothetical protein VTN49DRAFT_979 [Thermomyces lanuginosus]|uniref:uncharacterized protein n=1 Tax=Thermomyces lanuginosus TaxID=5541 RepID=UPI003742CF0C